jgi:hypothetical protein
MRSKAERREGGGRKVDSEMMQKKACNHNRYQLKLLAGNASRRASNLVTQRLLVEPLLLFLQTSGPSFNYYDGPGGRSRHVLELTQAKYEVTLWSPRHANLVIFG